MKISKEEIKKGLKKLGLKRGDKILVHSSLSSIGLVENGAETVIKALQETVEEEGLIMMPYPLGGATIAKVFSNRPGVVRSFHPTHSVSAWGNKANFFIKDHIKSPTACGRNTPYGRLLSANGYVLLIGVDQDRNTILHTIEEYANLPYLSEHKIEYIDPTTGKKIIKILKKFPGPHRNFIGIDKLLLETGAMKIGKIGNAVVRLIKTQKMADVLIKELRKNPSLFLCDNPNCLDCVIQRGKIAGLNLKSEVFKLTAVNDEISDNIEDVITSLKKEGIKYVELRNIYGKNLLKIPPKILHQLKNVLKEEGILVSGINMNVAMNDFFNSLKKSIALLKFFDGNYIVIHPLTNTISIEEFRKYMIRATKLARASNITLVLENMPNTVYATPKNCFELLKTINSPELKFAFNPANFAKIGEKPFLGTPPSLRKWIHVLYVNDGLFSGEAILPGYGNAEIKELISIMRCRSFEGFLSIKPGLTKTPDTFLKAVRALQRLLETM